MNKLGLERAKTEGSDPQIFASLLKMFNFNIDALFPP